MAALRFQRSILLTAVLFFLLTSPAMAGLIGGNPTHINSFTPTRITEGQSTVVTLSGHFPRHQNHFSLVLEGPQGKTALQASSWGRHQIRTSLPGTIKAGKYALALFKNGHFISRKGTLTVWPKTNSLAGNGALSREISPHPISSIYTGDSICSGGPLNFRIKGGPFMSNSGRYLRIGAVAASDEPGEKPTPTVRATSNNLVSVQVPRCFVLQRNARVRLRYPDGEFSNWIGLQVNSKGLIVNSHPTNPTEGLLIKEL